MCGIAGFLGPKGIATNRVEACLSLMGRRGPDAAVSQTHQLNSGGVVQLLHSRLSIIDLDDRANQPFETPNGILSYNGELYNYLEVKKDLESRGVNFSTSSDTEVLARLLNTEGLSGLDKCEGMWGFAWFDKTGEALFLCRDRFAEKPLYYYEDNTGLYFGSEPKFIFALLGRRLSPDEGQIKRYLVNGYKSLYKQPATFFQGLKEVPRAAFSVHRIGQPVKEVPYWVAEFDRANEQMTYEEAVQGAKERLIRSMELRLRADVPIAFCLSGGIDSNALISIAQRELGYDVHGFTIMNTDSRYEERDMVEIAVKELEIRHTEIPVSTENFLPNLRELVRYHDAPIYTITYYAQWRLMEEIHNAGYKISVSGTGADELFSGYYDHHNAYLAAMSDNPDYYSQALQNWQEVVKPIVRNPYLQDPDYFIKSPEGRNHIYLDADVFADFLNHPFEEKFVEEKYSQILLRNRMANELFHESVPVILHEDDLNAMYYSVENRSPFLDRDVFDWCQTIPSKHLINKGCAKAILRDAVRGLAPSAIIDNPRKVGFNAPVLDYLDVTKKPVRDELLNDSPIFDIIDKNKIAEILVPGEMQNSRSKFLFNFVCAKIFLEEYA
ncbi:asparagine synthase (glutamine-hydrolyzing) [Kiloniella majae]|uniref:asparagine synthase (glutamine-hydrolyzing) n=1 Tax=Kiloniella majae TaxID=1938558 RepID=UPI000A2785EC|nr:asparagine synthase (glutamine-hydrolyzing) [Kiloniella majae]